MATAIFPRLTTAFTWGWRGLSWRFKKSPMMQTRRQTAISGREAAVCDWAAPKWKYTLTWTYLHDDSTVVRNGAKTFPLNELEQLVSFFLTNAGLGFFLKDPSDYRVTAQTLSPSTPAGVTDYQLVRAFGNGGFVEPVGGLNIAETYQIRDDGTPTSVTPNTPYDGWIRFASAPSTGSVLTGDYHFYHLVRFAKDELGLDAFLFDFWEAKTVELVTHR